MTRRDWSCEHCGYSETEAPRKCDYCGGMMCFECTEYHDEHDCCPPGTRSTTEPPGED